MLKSGFTLSRPIVLVLGALGLLFAIDLFALAAYRELEQAAAALNQRLEAVQHLQALPTMMLEMQSGMRGYILTGSSDSLNRYRSAADQFPGAAQEALALLNKDTRQYKLAEMAVASTQNWQAGYVSPLVIKRGAGDDSRQTTSAILEIMRKNHEQSQAERILAQYLEPIRLERESVADAQLTLRRKLDRIADWMRGRALALLLAMAALSLMLGRTLAKLTGQIHSREVAESAMKTSSATLRAMSDASPLGMFLADRSGSCVQSNPSFARIAGLSESAVLGNGWQSTLHPEDRERVVGGWLAAITDGASFASVHRFAHRSGKVVWASMKSAKMSDGDQLIGFACSVEDVSERREAEEALRKSEERLHLALESSRLALFDWHVPSGEVFLSREWTALTGGGSQALTTTARRLNDQIHPQDRDALREAIVGVFKTEKPIARIEFRVETRSGQWKQVSCSGQVTERDASGRAVRVTGTITAMD